MKPVFANINLRKSASIFAAAAMLSLGTASLHAATPGIEKIISPSDKKILVNFVGATENDLVFHLNFENKSGEKFYLIVKNDAGEIVYQNSFKDVHFDKNVRITNEGSEVHPTFIIRTATETLESKVSVNRQVSENFVVTNY